MRVNQRKLKLLVNSDYFTEEELEKWGVLEEKVLLVSGILGLEEYRLFSKYCFEHNITKSEMLRVLLEKNINNPNDVLELSKRILEKKKEKKITFLVPNSQKREMKEFVQRYKEEYKMTESLLVRLTIVALLEEIYIKEGTI